MLKYLSRWGSCPRAPLAGLRPLPGSSARRRRNPYEKNHGKSLLRPGPLLGLLPTTALADDAWSPSTILYVGDVQLSGDTVSDTEGYYIQNEGGEWEKYTGPGTPSAPFFQYNGQRDPEAARGSTSRARPILL